MAFMMPLMNTIMNGLMLAVYWIGAYLIDAADAADKLTTFSNMVVFSSYSVQVIMSFLLMSMVFVLWPRADVSAQRVLEVLDTEPLITDGTRSDAGEAGKQGEIEFRNVSFTYPDSREAMLEGINFTAKKGETVAFIGSTGSGKSSLINLVPRFYDATQGEVLVDGVNVRDYTLKALRDKSDMCRNNPSCSKARSHPMSAMATIRSTPPMPASSTWPIPRPRPAESAKKS